jgi:hypothetical protein
VVKILLFNVITQPLLPLSQVALLETAFTISKKYSSQDVRVFGIMLFYEE